MDGEDCPKGTFNNEYNRVSRAECKDCWPGYACAKAGLLDPTDACEPGYFCSLAADTISPVEEAYYEDEDVDNPSGYDGMLK